MGDRGIRAVRELRLEALRAPACLARSLAAPHTALGPGDAIWAKTPAHHSAWHTVSLLSHISTPKMDGKWQNVPTE